MNKFESNERRDQKSTNFSRESYDSGSSETIAVRIIGAEPKVKKLTKWLIKNLPGSLDAGGRPEKGTDQRRQYVLVPANVVAGSDQNDANSAN